MFKQGSYIIDSDIRKIMIVECKQQTRRVKDRRQESSWGLLPAIQAAEAGSLDYTSSGRDGKAQKKKSINIHEETIHSERIQRNGKISKKQNVNCSESINKEISITPVIVIWGPRENSSPRGPLVFRSFPDTVHSGDLLFTLIKGIYCLRS